MRSYGLIFLAGLLVCSRASAEYELRNGIAAIANEAIITFQEVEQASAQDVEVYRRTYFNDPETFKQKRIEAMSDALEHLIERQLILHEFKTLGGVLSERYIDEEINTRIRQRFGDRVTLTKTLQSEGMTSDAFRQRTREELILSIMDHKNVREALLISPAKIERYYQTNLSRFKLGDQVKLRMIVLSRPPSSSADEIRQLVEEIRTKIEQGVPFAEMASIHSEGSQRKEGGLWGWVEESKLKKGLSEVAFALQAGQCSEVLGLARMVDDAYWIYHYDKTGAIKLGRKFTDRDVFLEEKKFDPQTNHEALPALPQEFYLLAADEKQVARVKSLEEVRDEIERDLLRDERARLRKKWIERLKLKSFVRYF